MKKFAIKRTTKTTYKISVLQNIILVCFDIVLLWIIVIITSFDNHYYDEDITDIGKPVNCKVIVNNRIELTEEEKAEARQRAISQYQAEELRKMQQRKSKSAAKPQEAKQTEPNLFGF